MEEYSLTEEAIGDLCTESSFERGYEYFNESAVLWVTRRGSQLFGEVQGSEYDPYGVCVTFNGAELIAADCTCPYDWGGYCKHIVATLLTCLLDSESVLERPPLSESLSVLSRDQLQGLVVELSEQFPRLTNLIDSLLLDLEPTSPAIG